MIHIEKFKAVVVNSFDLTAVVNHIERAHAHAIYYDSLLG